MTSLPLIELKTELLPRPSAPTWNRPIILGAVLFALFFALVTDHAWEDYFITFRSSRNLVEGHGLVFQPGERVHTFTSPLGVLIPALGLKLTGNDEGALWFLRILSIGAVFGATTLVVRGLPRKPLIAAVTVTIALLDSKTLQFATNGMETGLMVFFVALVWHELWVSQSNRILPLAFGFAGLMWTRPDGIIPAIAMLAGGLLFILPSNPIADRWRAIRRILISGTIGGLLYAPWFIWAWRYYGSPVPNTIIAKSAITGDLSLTHLLLAPLQSLLGPTIFDGTFAPTFLRAEDWPQALTLIWRLLARIAAFVWLLPQVGRRARAASFATLVGAVYLQQILAFSWYFAPWTLLGGIALSGVVDAAMESARRSLPAVRILVTVVTLIGVGTSIATMQTARVSGQWIARNGLKDIGEWLRNHSTKGDRVFVEPLGYIGYYSQLKMLDFPGLSAPEVTRLIRSGRHDYGSLIATLRPEWLVLRPYEIVSQHMMENGDLRAYKLVRAWDQQAHLDAVNWLPGRSSVEFDALFFLYRRQSTLETPSPNP